MPRGSQPLTLSLPAPQRRPTTHWKRSGSWGVQPQPVSSGDRSPLLARQEPRVQALPPHRAHLGCRCLPFPRPGAHPSCGPRPRGSSSLPGRLWAWWGPLPGLRFPLPGCSPVWAAAMAGSPASGCQSPPSRLAGLSLYPLPQRGPGLSRALRETPSFQAP